ncbi:hypothetical protein SH1V18_42630 [Vallitalea longa]|uniref:Cyclic nucleotide-binding domain-containing protein n=1 Tax=Vallitalea longa TaxID=2936439 RepID=A0A9W5YIA0_9FIRM|nr:cyclic nucleotide-binding domain-containing protein [Vallitalea longa]GKX31783.1 hypothetical protein SH1V18_42630 [Vallitalea longa]
MYNLYDEYLCKVLKLFLKKDISNADLEGIKPTKDLTLCKYKKVKTNTYILTKGFNVNSIYILLVGSCKCMVYSSFGNGIVADTMVSPYIFGLLELVIALPKYTASIITTKESVYLEVPVRIFQHAMKNSLIVSNICTCYFANVGQYYMDMAEIRALYNIDDTILLYIYNNCDKTDIPYKITTTRKTISHLLHINLRSLYRHLKILSEQKYFDVINGKITITEKQYDKLEHYCTNDLETKHYPIQIYPETLTTLIDAE